MSKITILGSGAMGTRIAQNLIEAGHTVTIYNRTRKNAAVIIEAGAVFAKTPIEAVNQADIIISMLANDEASKAVWLDGKTGAIHGLKDGAVAIESSTLSVAWIAQLAQNMATKKTAFLDAPVVDSRPQAESASLILLVGGDDETLEAARPALSALSSSIVHVGPSGTGTKMKLAVNAFFGVQVVALSEAIGVLEKGGIKKSVTIDIFNRLPTTSPALQGIGAMIAAENYTPLFPINLVEKDFRYALTMAEKCDVNFSSARTAHCAYKAAIEAGFGQDNIAGVFQLPGMGG